MISNWWEYMVTLGLGSCHKKHRRWTLKMALFRCSSEKEKVGKQSCIQNDKKQRVAVENRKRLVRAYVECGNTGGGSCLFACLLVLTKQPQDSTFWCSQYGTYEHMETKRSIISSQGSPFPNNKAPPRAIYLTFCAYLRRLTPISCILF